MTITDDCCHQKQNKTKQKTKKYTDTLNNERAGYVFPGRVNMNRLPGRQGERDPAERAQRW